MPELTASMLRERVHYTPETGCFILIAGKKAGHVAGAPHPRGYVQMTVPGHPRTVLAHRVAWLYVHGVWPDGEIDHINGVKTDNRIANLRIVSRQLNNQNLKRAPRTNKSTGVLGVWNYKPGKFIVSLTNEDGRRVRIGVFGDLPSAREASLSARRQMQSGFTL